MSVLSLAGTIASFAYPPAAPFIAIAMPIAEQLFAHRDDIAKLVNASMPAFDAIREVAPKVIPQITALASHMMNTGMVPPGKTQLDVEHALSGRIVVELVPGWTPEEAHRWWDHQNAVS